MRHCTGSVSITLDVTQLRRESQRRGLPRWVWQLSSVRIVPLSPAPNVYKVRQQNDR